MTTAYTIGRRLGRVAFLVVLPVGLVTTGALDIWKYFRAGFRHGLYGEHVDDPS